jgi:pyruvate/2-oxoglutarate dehydrogenase complex dihydrolipoamide dehydrogenase (E3) component
MHSRGWVIVNDHLETNVPGVYALGDVKGGPAFTHLSYNDFQIVFHNLFNENKKTIKDRLRLYTLYTDPELGRVGLSEKEARQLGYEVKVGINPYVLGGPCDRAQ